MPKYSAYKALYFGTPNRAMDQLLFKQFLKLPSPQLLALGDSCLYTIRNVSRGTRA